MKDNLGRQSWTVMLVAGAVIFGMVLAASSDLTPQAFAEATGGGQPVTMEQPAHTGLPNFADLAAAVSPAVVSIQATRIEEQRGGGAMRELERFLNPRRRGPDQDEPQRRRSDASGSGFVVSGDGYIVTNHHVIEDSTELAVVLGGREYPAEIKGIDPATDLALLKIEPEEELDYLEMADSESVRVGDWIMVIGSPLQLQNSVSVGVVSAKGRSINITADRSLENFIQTDAAINFGNSGGPLVDLRGRVIGIATAINFGAENIGFAVPVNILKNILPQLRSTGSVRRGFLGVSIADLEYDDAKAFGLDSTDGALVTNVNADGPADEAGVRHGDIILGVDEHDIVNNRDLIDHVSSKPPGEKVKLRLFRNGKIVKVDLVLGERPPMDGQPVTREEEPEEAGPAKWMGITYQDLTSSMRSGHGVPDSLEGVIVTEVDPDSPLYDENVRPMDVIAEVNGQSIDSVAGFQDVVEGLDAGAYLRLYITRFDPNSGQTVSFFAIVQTP